jgi:hypothetical protein
MVTSLVMRRKKILPSVIDRFLKKVYRPLHRRKKSKK